MFGYAKPVPYNPYALRNPAARLRDHRGSRAPLSNLVLAVAAPRSSSLHWPVGPMRAGAPSCWCSSSGRCCYVNVGLACFNLIPLPAARRGDGPRGPPAARAPAQAFAQVERYGFIILIVLMYTGVARPRSWTPCRTSFLKHLLTIVGGGHGG